MLNAKTLAATELADALVQWHAHGDACEGNEQRGVRCDECEQLVALYDDAFAAYKKMDGPHGIEREPLPDRRERSDTQTYCVLEYEIDVGTGSYPDGRPGEVWLSMSREGSMLRGLLGSFATAVSLGLQHGVPLEAYVHNFVHTKFGFNHPEPIVEGNPAIKTTTSIMDLVFRDLALQYDTPLPLPPPKM